MTHPHNRAAVGPVPIARGSGRASWRNDTRGLTVLVDAGASRSRRSAWASPSPVPAA